MRTYLKNFGYFILLLGFVAPIILEIIAPFIPKKEIRINTKINIQDYLATGKQIIEWDSLKLELSYDADESIVFNNAFKANGQNFEKYLRSELLVRDPVFEHAIFLTAFFDQYDEDMPVGNFVFLTIFLEELENKLSDPAYEYFLNDLSTYTKEKKLDRLAEIVSVTLSYYYSSNQRYDKALEHLAGVPDEMFRYVWYSDLVYDIYWQNGQFKQIAELASHPLLSDSLSMVYRANAESVIKANSLIDKRPEQLGLIPKSAIIFAIVMIFGVVIFLSIELYDYIKIFGQYKDRDLQRQNLLRVIKGDEEAHGYEDLHCPICGKGASDTNVVNQKNHFDFHVCDDHQEILIPINSCDQCGSPLDESLNCKVCAFNQKRELGVVFTFDVISVLMLIAYTVSWLVLLINYTFDFSEEVFARDKMLNSAMFIVFCIWFLLPFILRDASFSKKGTIFQFERLYLISSSKFLLILFYKTLIVNLLIVVDAGFQSQYFITFNDAIWSPIYIYGLYCFISYGSHHQAYQKGKIRDLFRGGVHFVAWLMVAVMIRDVAYTDWFPLMQINNVSWLEKIIFVAISVVVFINRRKLNANEFLNDLTLAISGSFRSIFNLLMGGLVLCGFLKIYYFVTVQYIDLTQSAFLILLSGGYYFIVGHKVYRKEDKGVQSFKALHNVQITFFLLTLFLIQYLGLFGQVYQHTRIYFTKGIYNALNQIISYQIIDFFSYKSYLSAYSYLFIASVILFILIIGYIAIRQVYAVFHFVSPKKYVSEDEAKRTRLLSRHFKLFADAIRRAISRKELDINTLPVEIYEQKYLVATSESASNYNSRKIVDSLIEEKDPIRFEQKFEEYSNEMGLLSNHSLVELEKTDYYEEVNFAETLNTVIVWENNTRKYLFSDQKMSTLLQLESVLWRDSINMYSNALYRFHLQLGYLSSVGNKLKPYSIAEQNYFAIVFSDQAYLPPSVSKLIAMRRQNVKAEDFTYIYFCDNFPQLNTWLYFNMSQNNSVIDALETYNSTGKMNADEMGKYLALVNDLRRSYDSFVKKITEYGYRCEFYETNMTIKVAKGLRTPGHTAEKPNAAGNLVKIKQPEYFQAKMVMVVEKANYQEIRELDRQELLLEQQQELIDE